MNHLEAVSEIILLLLFLYATTCNAAQGDALLSPPHDSPDELWLTSTQEHQPTNSILENFVESEADKLVKQHANDDGGCKLLSSGKSLSMLMDTLAGKLKNFVSQGKFTDSILDELSKATDVMELIVEKRRQQQEYDPPASLKRLVFRLSLSNALDDNNDNDNNSSSSSSSDSSSLHIVHADRRLSEYGLEELKQFANLRSEAKEKLLRSYLAESKRIHELRRETSKNKPVLLNFLMQIVQIGLTLVDHLYLSTPFLDNLPTIGNEILKLKQKGYKYYELIKSIRSLKSVMDLYKEVLIVGSELKNIKKFPINGEEETKLIGGIGLDSLRWLASQLLRRNGIEHDVQLDAAEFDELVRRCAYYLLIHFATKSPSCKYTPAI